MGQSTHKDSQGGFDLRRIAVIVIVGLVLFSGVGGLLIGSTGIAAAQQQTVPGKIPGDNDRVITKGEFRQWFNKVAGASTAKKLEFLKQNPRLREILARTWLRLNDMSTSPERVNRLEQSLIENPRYVFHQIGRLYDGKIPVPKLPTEKEEENSGGGGGKGGGGGGGKGGGGGGGKNGDGGGSVHPKVKSTIEQFKSQNLGWSALSAKQKKEAKNILQKLATHKYKQKKQNKLVENINQIFLDALGGGAMGNQRAKKRKSIIANLLGARKNSDLLPEININIPSLLDIKLDALADSLMDAVGDLLTQVYKFIFDTPVPVNSGWHQILGHPTNGAYKTLYTALMEERLYPVMRILLGIALIFLAGAVALPQFRRRNQIVDLFINLVAGITLFSFAWPVATFMHGITDDITMWILPNVSQVASSATNLLSMAGAPIAMYLFGAGGLFSTLFVLGLEVGLRRVLLIYILPYLLGPVLLIRFVSPWVRLRQYASMFIWQYVNVLAITIPMAIIMRAIIAIKWNLSVSGFGAVLVIIALFLVMIAIPIVSTWFFLQVPGMVNQKVQSVASGARSRMPSARDAFGGARSAANTTATGGRAVHSRAKSMVGAARTARTALPSFPSPSVGASTATATSTTASSDGSNTTAGEIRDHNQQNNPMSGERQKNAYMSYHTGDDGLPTSGNLGR